MKKTKKSAIPKRNIIRAELPDTLYAMVKKEVKSDWELSIGALVRRSLTAYFYEKAKSKLK